MILGDQRLFLRFFYPLDYESDLLPVTCLLSQLMIEFQAGKNLLMVDLFLKLNPGNASL